MAAFYLSLALLLPGEATEAELLREAEQAFAEGLERRDEEDGGVRSFRRSAVALASLRKRGLEGAALFANEGNAWLLAGDVPRAIVAYRLGLREYPEDEGLRVGLANAREEVKYPGDAGSRRPPDEPIAYRVSPRLRFVGMVLCWSLACLAVAGWRLVGGPAWLVAGVLAGGLAAFLAVGLLRDQGANPSFVVVRRDEVLLRQGNGDLFPVWSETPLSRGTEAEVLFERDGWFQVRLFSGEVGWVSGRECWLDGF